MTRRRRSIAVLAGVAAGLFFACASEKIVQVRESAATAGQGLQLKRVAITPFRAMPRPGGGALPDAAPALVAGYVGEAFAGRGLEVVPASDVGQAIVDAGGVAGRSVVQIAAERFGADAVVMGSVYRWRDRSGQAMGSITPASVGYEIKVLSSSGKVLWSGVFDHTQVALGVNALVAAQYPGGGTRWMTAEELARWGATRMAAELPLQ